MQVKSPQHARNLEKDEQYLLLGLQEVLPLATFELVCAVLLLQLLQLGGRSWRDLAQGAVPSLEKTEGEN